MTYKLWDKKSNRIYDITAEQAMQTIPKYRDEDSLRILPRRWHNL